MNNNDYCTHFPPADENYIEQDYIGINDNNVVWVEEVKSNEKQNLNVAREPFEGKSSESFQRINSDTGAGNILSRAGQN